MYDLGIVLYAVRLSRDRALHCLGIEEVGEGSAMQQNVSHVLC